MARVLQQVRPCCASCTSRFRSTYHDAFLIHDIDIQAVGPLNALGTRLLPSELFSTEEGRAKLGALINETLPFAAPYIVPGTPWLYKPLPGVAGETAVTPAWRDAIWHLSVRWEFMFDDTLEEREHGYKTLMEKVQKFRDLSPGSGAYFVSTM